MNHTLNCAIIEDNQSDLEVIESIIKSYKPYLKIVFKTTEVKNAASVLNEIQPEILIVDVELGQDSSFSILDELTFDRRGIIITTSHPMYGVKSYDYDALGYIIKPVSIEKLLLSIDKVEKYISFLDHSINLNQTELDVLAVSSEKNIVVFNKKNILYCEADGRYTTFYTVDNQKIIASRNLGEYEKLLPLCFVRIHHKFLVNLNYVETINKEDGLDINLVNGIKLPISRRKLGFIYKYLNLK